MSGHEPPTSKLIDLAKSDHRWRLRKLEAKNVREEPSVYVYLLIMFVTLTPSQFAVELRLQNLCRWTGSRAVMIDSGENEKALRLVRRPGDVLRTHVLT